MTYITSPCHTRNVNCHYDIYTTSPVTQQTSTVIMTDNVTVIQEMSTVIMTYIQHHLPSHKKCQLSRHIQHHHHTRNVNRHYDIHKTSPCHTTNVNCHYDIDYVTLSYNCQYDIDITLTEQMLAVIMTYTTTPCHTTNVNCHYRQCHLVVQQNSN